jgi:hypothetical protein
MKSLDLLFSIACILLLGCIFFTLMYKRRVINKLKAYPSIYSKLGLTDEFNDNQIEVENDFYKFISLSRYLSLNDEDLNRLALRYKVFGRISIALFCALLVIGFFGGRILLIQ